VTWWFTVPHIRISTEPPSGDQVQLNAGAGLGYQYRWDFDSDGRFDTAWSSDTTVSHTYDTKELRPGVVAVLESAIYGQGLSRRHLALGDKVQLDASDLGPSWQRGDDDTPPLLEATTAGLVVQRNGARLRKDGNALDEDKIVLARGEHVDIGQARLTAAALATPTLRVRNAFGVERQNNTRLLLPEVKPRPPVEVVGLAEAAP
jgi:hypothetical protein